MKKFSLLLSFLFLLGCATLRINNPPVNYKSVAYELVKKGWDALSKKNFTDVRGITDQCIRLYSGQAKVLNEKCGISYLNECSLLNDVAQCFYIKGEAYFKANNYQEYQKICDGINKWYFNGLVYDFNGWPWKPAEACKSRLEGIKQ